MDLCNIHKTPFANTCAVGSDRETLSNINQWFSPGLLPVLLLTAIMALAPAASALDRTWSGLSGSSSNWSDAANWDVVPVSGDGVIFATGNRLTPINNNSGFSYQLITFNAGSGAFTLSGSSLTLTGNITNNDDDPQTINIAMTWTATRTVATTSGSVTIGGVISGGGGLTKTGTATLTLSATNTFTGITAVQNGTLSINSIDNLSSNSAIGAPTTEGNGTIALGNGTTTGVLVYTGGTKSTNRRLSFPGTTGGATIDQSGSGTLTFSNTNIYTASGGGIKTLTLRGSTSGTGVLSGVIENNNSTNKTSLVKTGTSTWTLSGTSTYTGTTTISQGTLKAGIATAAFGSNSAVTIADAANTTLDIQGYDNAIGSLSGSVTGTNGNVILTGNTLTTGGNNTSTTYSGVMSGAGGALTKTGTGTFTLSGTNTYTGATTVSNGTLIVTGALASGSAVSVSSGATLGGTGTVAGTVSIASGGTISPGVGGAGTINTGTLTLGSTSALAFDLAAPAGTNDKIVITGNLTLDGELSVSDLGGFTAGTYTIITYSGSLTANNGLTISSLPSGYAGSISISGGNVTLTVTVSPEVTVVGSWVDGLTHAAEAGSNRLLLVFISGKNVTNPFYSSGVTYGGQTMLRVCGAMVGGTYYERIEAWYLNESGITAASSGTIVVSFSPTPSVATHVESVFLTNVNQSSPIGAKDSNTNTNTNTIATSALATTDGDMGFVAGMNQFTGTFSFSNGFTQTHDCGLGNFDQGEGTIACTGTDVIPGVSHSSTARMSVLGFVVQATISGTTWDGGGADSYWQTDANWNPDGKPAAGANLIFAGGTRLSPVNDFAAATNFGSIYFSNTAGAFTLSGSSITLTGSITNNDADLQTIGLDMAWAGTRTVSAATGNVSISGVISGVGGLTKSGNYTLTLSATNTYTGATTISAGTLSVTGRTSSSSAITVASGSTLGGTGTVAGSVTVSGGGTIAPGVGGAGTLNAGALTLEGTSGLSFDLAAPAGISDKIVVTGALTLDGALTVNELSGFTLGDYTLMTYTGTLIDNTLTVNALSGGYGSSITAGSGTVVLSVTDPAPPTTPVTVIGSWVNGTTHAVEAGSGRLFLVFASAENNGVYTCTGMTYGGQTMTRLCDTVVGTGYRNRMSVYYLNEAGIIAASGSTIAVSYSTGPTSGPYVESVFLSGVKQSAPIGAKDSASNDPITTITTSALATAYGDMAFVAGVYDNVGTMNVNNSFSKDYDGSHTIFDEVVGHIACTGAPVTPSITAPGNSRQAMVGFVVQTGTKVWDGGGGNDNWSSSPANWLGDVAPAAGWDLIFAGNTRLTPNCDFSGATSFATITFNNTAGAFTLGGTQITLTGNITNNDADLQTISMAMVWPATRVVNAASGNVAISGVISGAGGLTKSGTATLTLSATNTYTGPTTVSKGTLKAGVAGVAFGANSAVTMNNSANTILDIAGYNATIGSLAGGGANGGDVILTGNTLTTGGDNTSTTYAGVLSGAGGGLTKSGSGTFTLSGTSTFTGATTINNGTLLVTGATNASSAVAVNSGGTLGGTGTVAGAVSVNNGGTMAPGVGGIGTLNTGAVTFSATSTYSVDLDGGGPTYDQINSSGAVALGTANELTVATLANSATNDAYVIVIGTSRTGTFNGKGEASTFDVSGRTLRINYTATQVTLTDIGATGSTDTHVWDGGGNPDFNWNTGANWVSNIAPTAGDYLQFAGSTGTTNTNNITAATSFGSITFNAGAGAFTLGGTSITLSGSLTNSSTNTQTVNVDITFTATRTIDAASANITAGGIISGSGGLTKSGTATLTLSGTSTYNGATAVNSGTLLVTGGTNAASAVTVNNGGTLAGTGTVAGAVTVNGGGTIVPGNGGAGTLNTGTLTLGTTSVLTYECAAPAGTSDKIIVTGAITLAGTINFTNIGGFAAGTYTLMTYTTTVSGGLSIGTFPATFGGVISTGGGNVTLTVSDVITPSWTATSLGSVNGGAISHTALYIGTGSGATGALRCLNLSTGATTWSYSTTPDPCRLPTYVWNGTNYKIIATAGSNLVGVLDDGNQLWAPCALGGTAGNPYVTPDDGNICVIAGTTLTRRSLANPTSISLTQTCTNVSVGADMVVMNDEVYVAATDGVVTKIDYDGTPISTWTVPNRGAGVPGVYLPLMAATVADSLLYVFPKDEMAYSVKTSTMTTSGTWTYAARDTNCGPAFMSFDGHTRSGVIYTSAGKKIYKLTEGSGAPTWTYSIPGDSSLSGPVMYNGKFYFGTQDSSYYAVNDGGGSATIVNKWPYPASSGKANSGPWIDPNSSRLYFGTTGGRVDAFPLQ